MRSLKGSSWHGCHAAAQCEVSYPISHSWNTYRRETREWDAPSRDKQRHNRFKGLVGGQVTTGRHYSDGRLGLRQMWTVKHAAAEPVYSSSQFHSSCIPGLSVSCVMLPLCTFLGFYGAGDSQCISEASTASWTDTEQPPGRQAEQLLTDVGWKSNSVPPVSPQCGARWKLRVWSAAVFKWQV